MRRILPIGPVVIVLGVVLAACGGDGDTPAIDAASQATATALPSTSAPPATTATTVALATTTTTATAVRKVNANTASQSEIQSALAEVSVPSAGQWSREVVEYRPYPTNDPTFAKLRQNLAKYNPGPGVVDGIIAALSL